jgi:putative ABC transport system substrate-binding protein
VSPLTARAQQSPKSPVIGLLSSVSFQLYAVRVTAFQEGLIETGFFERSNITIEYRSADGRVEKLPALVADLVAHKVDVIVTIGGEIPARAAKTATSTIPIVFAAGGDPVDYGLVTSVGRPKADPLAFLMGSTSSTAKLSEPPKYSCWRPATWAFKASF